MAETAAVASPDTAAPREEEKPSDFMEWVKGAMASLGDFFKPIIDWVKSAGTGFIGWINGATRNDEIQQAAYGPAATQPAQPAATLSKDKALDLLAQNNVTVTKDAPSISTDKSGAEMPSPPQRNATPMARG